MTTQETNRMTATIGAFKIAMDRAFDQGFTPDQFVKMMMTNQEKFISLVDACQAEVKF